MYKFCNRREFIGLIVTTFLLVLAGPGKLPAADIGLIEAAALNQSLSAWVILDARPDKEWQAGHIPGARSYCWKDYTRTDEKGIPFRILPPQQLVEALGKIGIDENTPVAIYGDADSSWGGEGWACWTLAWLGHKGPIRLLHGGIQVWRAQDLPIKTGKEAFNGKVPAYHYQIQPSVNITADDIRNNSAKHQLVDTRSTLDWIKGHIPGAKHIPWEKFFTGKNRRPITPAEARALLMRNGINPDQPVVYYCAGGIRSGYAWLIHHLSGLPEAVNYEGGMSEWEKSAP